MARRSSKRRSGRRTQNRNYFALAAMVLLSTSALSAMGYVAYQDMNTVKADLVGCYATPQPKDQTVILVDSSEPRFDAVQSRDLKNAIKAVYDHDLDFNENLKIFTTEKTDIGSIPAPVLEICGSARTTVELEEIGASDASQAFLDRQRQQVFEKTVAPILDQVFAREVDDAQKQDRESPILEQLQNMARLREMHDQGQSRKLIIVSDMIQHTVEMQACSAKGHLPSFAKFQTQPYFKQVRPKNLNGVEATVYLLVRPGLGQGAYSYCTEDELVQFWQDYFDAAGASVTFIRLRDGAYVASDT
ncbi:hypothetical protein [Lentilitoribacter sp. EG35]|uniref:hypothetical protein n=1 Tax=Lentilitoribacter sp. EG35 TaxID=3234192 RepID=UPI0034602CA0